MGNDLELKVEVVGGQSAQRELVNINKTAQKAGNSMMTSLKKSTDQIVKHMSQGFQQLGNVVSVAFAGIAAAASKFLSDSVDSFNNYQKSMTTLAIVSEKFGQSVELAQQRAADLGKELRIGVGSSAEALQNLLQSGLNIDQATELLRRFTNEAMTGKAAGMDLGEAVQNLAFAYKTEMSALMDRSGISENISTLMEKEADLMGVNLEQLDEAARAQLKYNAFIRLTNLTLGSSEKFQGTYIDNLAIMRSTMEDLRIEIGAKLTPILNELLIEFMNSGSLETFKDIMLDVVDAIGRATKFMIDNKDEIASFVKTFGVLAAVAGSIAAAFSVASSPLALVVGLIAGAAVVIQRFKDPLELLGQQIMTAVVPAFNMLRDSFLLAVDKIKTSDAFQKLKEIIDGNAQALRYWIEQGVKMVQENLPMWKKTIEETVIPALENLLNSLVNAMGVDSVEEMTQKMKEFADIVIENLPMWKKTIEETVIPALENLLNSLVNAMGVDSVEEMTQKMKEFADIVIENLPLVIEELIKFVGWVIDAVAWVIDFGTSIKEFVDKLADFGAKVHDFQYQWNPVLKIINLVKGAVDGLQASLNALTGTGVSGAAQAAVSQVSSVAPQSGVPAFAEGGILGGASYQGDRLLFQGNSGEMVLNRQDQNSLFSFIKSLSSRPQVVNNNITGNVFGGNRSQMQQENNFVNLLTQASR